MTTDVLVVGGGIAGPALAAALAPTNFSVILLERNAEPLDTARGDHLQPRSLDILERWGALDSLQHYGMRTRAGTVWYDAHGNTLLDIDTRALEMPQREFAYLNHEHIGAGLLDAAGRSDDFQLLRPIRSWKLEERSEDAAIVRVTLSTGDSIAIRTQVIIGADGRNSAVRKTAGIEADIHRYRRPVNVLFGEYADRPGREHLAAYLTPDGIVAVIPRADGGCKIGVTSAASEVSGWRNASPLELLRRVSRYTPGLNLKNLCYGGVYPPVRVTTRRWCDGNMVLIGDACHALHPAQSQGMNLTIRSADRLADALRAHADRLASGLLDYERKARPALGPLLEQNHRAGLMFDSTDSHELETFATKLKEVQANLDARKAYALQMSGY